MSVNHFIVNWNEYQCLIESNVDFYLWHKYIKDVKSLLGKGKVTINNQNIVQKQPDNKLVYTNSDNKSLVFDGSIIYYSFPWEEAIHNDNFECILLLIFLRKLYISKIAALHASGVVFNGKAIIFLGPKESGKTSVALNLCKQYNAKLLCNDYINIMEYGDGMVAFGGDGMQSISFRSHALQKIEPALFERYFDYGEYGRRQRIRTSELNIQTEQKRIEIKKIIFIGLGQSEMLSVDNKITTKTMVDLYANMTELIKGVSMVLFNHKEDLGLYIPEVFTSVMHQNVHEMIQKLCQSRSVMSIRGNMDEITQYITNEL